MYGKYTAVLCGDPQIASWIYAAMPDDKLGEPSADAVSVVVYHGERPVGGWVIDGFRIINGQVVDCVWTTVAAPEERMLSPEIFYLVCFVTFNLLKARRVTSTTTADNLITRRALKMMGAREEGVLRESWDGDRNLLVYGLLAREARFNKPKYHKKYLSRVGSILRLGPDLPEGVGAYVGRCVKETQDELAALVL